MVEAGERLPEGVIRLRVGSSTTIYSSSTTTRLLSTRASGSDPAPCRTEPAADAELLESLFNARSMGCSKSVSHTRADRAAVSKRSRSRRRAKQQANSRKREAG